MTGTTNSRGADYVFNAVSSVAWHIAGYRSSYVGGMESMLRWAGDGSTGTLVYTSSTSVYPQDNGALVDESASTEGVGRDCRRYAGRGKSSAPSRTFERRTAFGREGPWDLPRLHSAARGNLRAGRHHLLDQVRSGKVAGRASIV